MVGRRVPDVAQLLAIGKHDGRDAGDEEQRDQLHAGRGQTRQSAREPEHVEARADRHHDQTEDVVLHRSCKARADVREPPRTHAVHAPGEHDAGHGHHRECDLEIDDRGHAEEGAQGDEPIPVRSHPRQHHVARRVGQLVAGDAVQKLVHAGGAQPLLADHMDQGDAGPQANEARDRDGEDVGPKDGLARLLDLAAHVDDEVVVDEQDEDARHEAESRSPRPRGRDPCPIAVANGADEVVEIHRAVPRGDPVPVGDEDGLRGEGQRDTEHDRTADGEKDERLLDRLVNAHAEGDRQERAGEDRHGNRKRAPLTRHPGSDAVPAEHRGEKLDSGYGEAGRDEELPVEAGEELRHARSGGDHRVQDARVEHVLAAATRHGAAQHPPDDRRGDADQDDRDDDGDDDLTAREKPVAQVDHLPDGEQRHGDHDADAEGIEHGKAADEPAGLAGVRELFRHQCLLLSKTGAISYSHARITGSLLSGFVGEACTRMARPSCRT